MMTPSSIQPDIELREFLTGRISVGLVSGGSEVIPVYGNWEKPTNNVPDDFLVIFENGDIGCVGMKADFAKGYLTVSLYCKLNDDGTVKKNRVTKLIQQFDNLIQGCTTKNYFFEYDSPRFITPTTPNQGSGYSVTTLNIKWHTTENFNKTS